LEQQTDFLIIGSGISGLSFALKAAQLGRVTLITKKGQADSATNLAQGESPLSSLLMILLPPISLIPWLPEPGLVTKRWFGWWWQPVRKGLES